MTFWPYTTAAGPGRVAALLGLLSLNKMMEGAIICSRVIA